MSERKIVRGDQTREKLVGAAVDVFGRVGFDAATTRMLSDAAGANQQAIAYYFGNKEGLYRAAAASIADGLSDHIAPLKSLVFERVEEARLKSVPLATNEARWLLCEIVRRMAVLFVSNRSEPWARFLSREQMQPTVAFHEIYEGVMGPLLSVCDQLVGTLLGEDPASQHVRLRTLSLVGSVLVFRMARASVLSALGWEEIDDRGLSEIEALAVELVASISPVLRVGEER
jgi:AcrR family transcriptional regulator